MELLFCCSNNQTPRSFLRWYWAISIALGLISGAIAICLQFWIFKAESNICVHATIKYPVDWPGLIIFLIPALLSCLFCCISYITIIKQLYHYRSELFIELLIYPLILVVCDFPTAIRGLYFTATEENPTTDTFLFHLCTVLLRSQEIFLMR